MPPRTDRLADAIREVSPAIAVAVTDVFLDRHPEWRERYGARATSFGIQDAGYHLAFLAGAVEASDLAAFASYARWTAGVLGARQIAASFLLENLEQLRDALRARLRAEDASSVDPYFSAAREALSATPEAKPPATLSLTANVFLQAILTGQRHAAVQIAREALNEGLTIPQLYVDVFQPALYEVGARWEANRLTVAQEHIATAITQFVMAQIYTPPDADQREIGNVVLTGVEGELHNIGAVMVGDLLESAGWRVRFLGTNLPSSSILSVVRETAPTYLGISVTMLFNVSAVRQLIQAIRAEFSERLLIVVGGAAFRVSPELWRQVGADAFAADLREVQTVFAHQS
jgi:MerR family transcriptional regulator, light-induced transcriptional regulator